MGPVQVQGPEQVGEAVQPRSPASSVASLGAVSLGAVSLGGTSTAVQAPTSSAGTAVNAAAPSHSTPGPPPAPAHPSLHSCRAPLPTITAFKELYHLLSTHPFPPRVIIQLSEGFDDEDRTQSNAICRSRCPQYDLSSLVRQGFRVLTPAWVWGPQVRGRWTVGRGDF